MHVRELMTKNPVCCTRETPLQQVARMMLDSDCGEIPVVDSLTTLRPIGAVTDRDITCRAVAHGKNPLTMTAGECMSSPCITIHQDAGIEDCCRLMEEHQIRRVPVVDQSGRCCGIVAQADIAQAVDEVAVEVLKQVSQPAAGRAEERH